MFGKKKRSVREGFCTAVVAAAGSGSRMGQDKIIMDFNGRPVIYYTLKSLDDCPLISEIVVVTREDLIQTIGGICEKEKLNKVSKIIRGGETRQESVFLGLSELSSDTELVAVHDGARPFAPQDMIAEVIRKARDCGAAAPAVPVTDTVKIAEDGVVVETPDRSKLFFVQTPQVFQTDLLRAALQDAIENGIELTDDCSAVERIGMKVSLTQGSAENIKLTRPADLELAEILISRGIEDENRTGV